MTTQIVGVKQFRQNITSYWKKAKKKNIRYIVMFHSVPILEVNPIKEDTLILEKLAHDVSEARDDIKNGNVYTEEEVFKELGL